MGIGGCFWAGRGILRSTLGTQALHPLGVILIATGILLFLARAVLVAIPLMILGIVLLTKKHGGAVSGPASQTSSVRSTHLKRSLIPISEPTRPY